MSDSSNEPVDDHEQYAYSIIRKLFWYTAIGALAFSGIMVALWYVL